jgi:hypothetical protein
VSHSAGLEDVFFFAHLANCNLGVSSVVVDADEDACLPGVRPRSRARSNVISLDRWRADPEMADLSGAEKGARGWGSKYAGQVQEGKGGGLRGAAVGAARGAGGQEAAQLLGDRDVVALSALLQHCTHLTSIDLSHNAWGDPAAEYLSLVLQRLNALTAIDIRSNPALGEEGKTHLGLAILANRVIPLQEMRCDEFEIGHHTREVEEACIIHER